MLTLRSILVTARAQIACYVHKRFGVAQLVHNTCCVPWTLHAVFERIVLFLAGTRPEAPPRHAVGPTAAAAAAARAALGDRASLSGTTAAASAGSARRNPAPRAVPGSLTGSASAPTPPGPANQTKVLTVPRRAAASAQRPAAKSSTAPSAGATGAVQSEAGLQSALASAAAPSTVVSSAGGSWTPSQSSNARGPWAIQTGNDMASSIT